MDRNFNANQKRRRSNLGKRNLYGDRPPLRPVSMLSVPTSTGLGRSRSTKKTPLPLNKPSRSFSIKKRLFLKSSPSDVPAVWDYNGKLTNNSPFFQFPRDNSLNVTGIKSIKTPSPEYQSASGNRHLKSTSVKSTKKNPFIFDDFMNELNRRNEVKSAKLPASNYYVLGELKPPQSPGPSCYNRLILDEFANLKPPVDPDDLLRSSEDLDDTLVPPEDPSRNINCTQRFCHTDKPKTSPKTESLVITENPLVPPQSRVSLSFSPHLSSTCLISPPSERKINIQGLSRSANKKDLKLSVINEDLDTTDTFLMNEQSIIDQNETIMGPPSSLNTATKVLSVNKGCMNSVAEEGSNLCDINSKLSLQEIRHGIKDMEQFMESMSQMMTTMNQVMEDSNRMMERMKNTVESSHKMMEIGAVTIKTLKNLEHSVQSTLKKPGISSSIKNKENIPSTAFKSPKKKWINDLKFENPNLLKTPNLNVSRFNIADQSTILTPHSLSSVLHEQYGELFE